MKKVAVQVFASVLFLSSCFQADKIETNEENPLFDWIVTNGGKVDFHVGKACPTCVRGVLANRDFAADDLIAKVPFNLSVHFHPRIELYPADRAYELLERMHSYPEFNRTFRLWWESQPAPSEVLCPEVMTEQHLSMLQSEWLQYHARSMREIAEDYFYGRGVNRTPFHEVVARSSVSLDTFLYATALIVTRAFDFPITINGQQHLRPVSCMRSVKQPAHHMQTAPKFMLPSVLPFGSSLCPALMPFAQFLIPAVDLLNHVNPAEANTKRDNDNDFVYVIATKHIRRGEELVQPYHPGVTHRADMTFAIYGFVQRGQEPPLLCAQDLPAFDYANAFDVTPERDSDPHGIHATVLEVKRVQSILNKLPTTLEEDIKLSKEADDWKIKSILDLRVERKRALRYRISQLQRRLDAKEEL